MIGIIEIYQLLLILLLAGKDADSYLLKDHVDNTLTNYRIKRWHRDGASLWVLTNLPCLLLYAHWWWVILTAFLLRAMLFDLAFNHWSNLPQRYLGGTAWADKWMVNLFGLNGALRKSFFFLILYLVLNVLLIFKVIS